MLGFLGVSASEIEMLFVRDEARGSYSTHVPAAAPAGAGGSPFSVTYRSWLCSFLRRGSSRRKIWSMFRLTVCNSLNRCFCA